MDPNDNNQPGADPMAPAQTPQTDPNQGVPQQPIDVPVAGEAPAQPGATPMVGGEAPASEAPVNEVPGAVPAPNEEENPEGQGGGVM